MTPIAAIVVAFSTVIEEHRQMIGGSNKDTRRINIYTYTLRMRAAINQSLGRNFS